MKWITKELDIERPLGLAIEITPKEAKAILDAMFVGKWFEMTPIPELDHLIQALKAVKDRKTTM